MQGKTLSKFLIRYSFKYETMRVRYKKYLIRMWLGKYCYLICHDLLTCFDSQVV